MGYYTKGEAAILCSDDDAARLHTLSQGLRIQTNDDVKKGLLLATLRLPP